MLDGLRDYVVAGLGDENAVLVVDETGDLKKGEQTVGVWRQHTGTSGRVDNAQVAHYLTYATGGGHAFIDRELYLPRSCADDRERRATAGVPADVEFVTKPTLTRLMIARALDAGVGARWVAGDEVCGADALHAELENRQVGYVLAVACDWPPERASCAPTASPNSYRQGVTAAVRRSRRQGCALRLGRGRHRPDPPGHRWLLIRRHRSTGELAYDRCYATPPGATGPASPAGPSRCLRWPGGAAVNTTYGSANTAAAPNHQKITIYGCRTSRAHLLALSHADVSLTSTVTPSV